MDSYTSFAQVYDLFMDNVDYPAWCEYIKSLLKEYGISDGLVRGSWLRNRNRHRTSGRCRL